mgnify:CR=1 FL=1
MKSTSHAASTHVNNSYVMGKSAALITPHMVADFGDWAVGTKAFVQHIEIE